MKPNDLFYQMPCSRLKKQDILKFDRRVKYSINSVNAYRTISQTVFMLSIAINRAEHVYATVIIEHNYMLMCNHKIVRNIMLCLLNSTGHI